MSFNKGLCLVGAISWRDKHNNSTVGIQVISNARFENISYFLSQTFKTKTVELPTFLYTLQKKNIFVRITKKNIFEHKMPQQKYAEVKDIDS